MIQRELHRITHRWQQSILDLVYPPVCVGCGLNGFHWCPQCDTSIQKISEPICSNCGMPYPTPKTRCRRCQELPASLKVRSYAGYSGPLLRAIINLKYRPNQEIARSMGLWLADICNKARWSGTIIVPVPLGKKRMKQRGYNQAELIAHGMAEEMNIPLGKNILRRIRETKSQVGLDPGARFQNVEEAFEAHPRTVKDQEVILVDDLLTTGATMVACTLALEDAGVKQVFGVTVARAHIGRR